MGVINMENKKKDIGTIKQVIGEELKFIRYNAYDLQSIDANTENKKYLLDKIDEILYYTRAIEQRLNEI